MSLLPLLSLLILAIPVGAWIFNPRKKWDPRGKHCYVTGGSAGLGLSLAILLTKRGSDVSIVARDKGRLAKALELMEEHRQTPNQLLKSYSFSLQDAEAARESLDAACEPHGGQSPDAVFLCAGTSRPGFFVEETPESLKDGMDNAYWAQAWSAYAASQRMIRTESRGKIILVSSILGWMSMIGYTTYSPAKFALRGLAEGLRSELLLYGIDVHILFPGTIYSPGYIEENKNKPAITLKIEERDAGLQPEAVAECLLDGVQRGNFAISVDFITTIFRTSTRGSTLYNNVIVDIIYELIGMAALADWRRGVDKRILSHRADHRKYLVDKGIIAQEPPSKSE